MVDAATHQQPLARDVGWPPSLGIQGIEKRRAIQQIIITTVRLATLNHPASSPLIPAIPREAGKRNTHGAGATEADGTVAADAGLSNANLTLTASGLRTAI